MISYQLQPMELSEYTRILPKYSNIDVCMYVDECSSFERNNHPLWMIVSDGDPYVDSWVAISLSNTPKILSRSNANINDNVLTIIEECKKFISKFYQILIDIGFEYVDSSIIYDILSKNDWRTLSNKDILNLRLKLYDEYSLVDNEYMSLAEMAILRPDITKLSFCVWIEPGIRQTNHNVDRIKFQDSSSTNSNTFYPIKLTPQGAELAECDHPCKASRKAKRDVINFVNKYRKIIDAFINCIIDEVALKDIIKNGLTEVPKKYLDEHNNSKITNDI